MPGVPLRVRLWWDRAFWPIPVLGIAVVPLLARVAEAFDELFAALVGESPVIAAGAAETFLAAVGGGMVTFTGFVFSFVLLLVQFGSSQYSPRTVTYFLRIRTTQVVLAIYLATIGFAFSGVLAGNVAGSDASPQGAVLITMVLLTASLIGFVTLLQSVGGRMRVDAVAARLGHISRERLVARTRSLERAGWTRTTGDSPNIPDGTPVRHTGRRHGQVLAVDHRRLRRLARRTGARIEVTVHVGDAVGPGSEIARVSGPRTVRASAVSRCVVVDVERSLGRDPTYALRLLVDIALRALSPAVNDPTTAVRALDEIESSLVVAAGVPLGTAELRAGRGHAVVRASTWSDVVELALAEIIEAGAGQAQVTRRITALLDALAGHAPEPRQQAIALARAHLREAVHRAGSTSADFRLTADRQGIGGARA